MWNGRICRPVFVRMSTPVGLPDGSDVRASTYTASSSTTAMEKNPSAYKHIARNDGQCCAVCNGLSTRFFWSSMWRYREIMCVWAKPSQNVWFCFDWSSSAQTWGWAHVTCFCPYVDSHMIIDLFNRYRRQSKGTTMRTINPRSETFCFLAKRKSASKHGAHTAPDGGVGSGGNDRGGYRHCSVGHGKRWWFVGIEYQNEFGCGIGAKYRQVVLLVGKRVASSIREVVGHAPGL